MKSGEAEMPVVMCGIMVIVAFALFLAFAPAQAPDQTSVPKRKLTAQLYPYLPNAADLYRTLEDSFELAHPDIDLEIDTDPIWYYTQPRMFSQRADVYEADCVFMKDLIARKRIKPLTIPVDLDFPLAKAVNVAGQVYGAPHWLCGNFFFCDKRDSPLVNASKLSDYMQALGKTPRIGRNLLIDLNGKSTLGELISVPYSH